MIRVTLPRRHRALSPSFRIVDSGLRLAPDRSGMMAVGVEGWVSGCSPILSSSVNPTNAGANPLESLHLSSRDDGDGVKLGEVAGGKTLTDTYDR